MKWWVLREGRVIGWVIAADEADAQLHADQKYPHGSEDGGQSLELAR